MNSTHKKAELSAQEKRVVELTAAGKIDKEIADEMGIALGTVREYWKRIGRKCGGATRTELVLQVVGRGEARSQYVGTRGPIDDATMELLRSLTLATLRGTAPGASYFEHLGRIRECAEECADHLTRLGIDIEASPMDDPDDEIGDSETADEMHRRAA